MRQSKLSRHPGEGRGSGFKHVFKIRFENWIPAFAGMTLAVFFLTSCTKEKRNVVSGSVTSGSSGPATLSTIQEDVFRLGCAVSGCHDNRATPAGDLSLASADVSHSGIVNINSTQATLRKLVVPGFPEDSYFVDKLKGTHLTAGGSGVKMPQYAATLDAGEVARIEEWITNGALRN